jgi:chitin disaccharide deacetylase
MKPNPVLRKLGFADSDRVAIIHTDDLGMCQATLTALADLVDFGLISSGAVMVPCPWFPQLAEYCRQHPGVDIGVHLTLTSEWDSYRWGPISTRDGASGLLDAEGYFHRRSEEVQHADPQAVQLEIQAQVDRARAAGIDVTHIDTHMGAVAHAKFAPAYVQLALQQRVPAMIARLDEAGWREVGLDAETAAFARLFVQQLEEQWIPLLDHVLALPLDRPENRVAQAQQAFGSLRPGLTHFIIHPAQDTPELRAITPTDWQSRVADYEAFCSQELMDYVKQSGVQVIGYRALQQLMP